MRKGIDDYQMSVYKKCEERGHAWTETKQPVKAGWVTLKWCPPCKLLKSVDGKLTMTYKKVMGIIPNDDKLIDDD